MTENPTVTRSDAESRYEIRVGDALAGFTQFHTDDEGRTVFPHTEIDKEFGGNGLGTTLVADALADVARRGETVVPECGFVVNYLKENEIPGLVVDWPDESDAQDSATPGEQAG